MLELPPELGPQAGTAARQFRRRALDKSARDAWLRAPGQEPDAEEKEREERKRKFDRIEAREIEARDEDMEKRVDDFRVSDDSKRGVVISVCSKFSMACIIPPGFRFILIFISARKKAEKLTRASRKEEEEEREKGEEKEREEREKRQEEKEGKFR